LAIKTEQSTESFLFYLIQYTITNLNTFFILLAFGYIINSIIKSNYINSDLKYIKDLKGQFIAQPMLSLSLAICLFSMAGIPPLIGFFGKQSVLLSAIGSGYYFMAIVAIIVSVISASYYLRIIKDLQSSDNTDNTLNTTNTINKENLINTNITITDPILADSLSKNILNKIEITNIPYTFLQDLRVSEAFSYLKITNIHAFIISSLTLIILLFVLKPSILLNSASLCTLNYFYL
jgi:NADH-ubiquinone oxidoreductase chain 2